MEELWKRQRRDSTSLGFFRPREVGGLRIVGSSAGGAGLDHEAPRYERDLFGETMPIPAEPLPVRFYYDFRCDGSACNGHSMMSVDWEISQSYRSWRRRYDDQGLLAAIKQRYLDEFANLCELRFFVGTVHRHPDSWIIVGSFHPRREYFGAGREQQAPLLQVDDFHADL